MLNVRGTTLLAFTESIAEAEIWGDPEAKDHSDRIAELLGFSMGVWPEWCHFKEKKKKKHAQILQKERSSWK